MDEVNKFDDFEWLLSQPEVKDGLQPDENTLKFDKNGVFLTQPREIQFVKAFHSKYFRKLSSAFLSRKIDALEDEKAKVWANYAMGRMKNVINYENYRFEGRLTKLMSRLKLQSSIALILFKPYMPFFTDKDYYKFALDNVDSPQYQYFYILLILLYEDNFPIDREKQYPYTFLTCPNKMTCKKRNKCRKCRRCSLLEELYGKYYDYANDVNDFQKYYTWRFLKAARKSQVEKMLMVLYESIKQINQTDVFDVKLSLSYNTVLFGSESPRNGRFFVRWDKVEFFNGFYLVDHPNAPFKKSQPCRVEDKNSRKAFNDINRLFIKKLPPLQVESKNGKIIKVLNQTNLSSCISIMEHKVTCPDIKRKKSAIKPSYEKKEITTNEAKTLCKELKSRYLDYLCSKQLDNYKVVCCIENRVNSSGMVSCEYSFIFTIKEKPDKIFLVYENASESRCSYILPISRGFWRMSIDKIYDFFASNEINKRQSMASGLIDLRLPGSYEHKRLYHKGYLEWVDNIKYCW